MKKEEFCLKAQKLLTRAKHKAVMASVVAFLGGMLLMSTITVFVSHLFGEVREKKIMQQFTESQEYMDYVDADESVTDGEKAGWKYKVSALKQSSQSELKEEFFKIEQNQNYFVLAGFVGTALAGLAVGASKLLDKSSHEDRYKAFKVQDEEKN